MIAERPRSNSGYFWRGRVNMCRGDDAQAIADFHVSLKIRPEDAWCCRHLAWLYLTADQPLRDVDAALPLAKKAVSLQPRSAIYLTTLGAVYYRRGELNAAIQTLESAEPQRLDTMAIRLLLLALSQQRAGRDEDARQLFSEARAYADQAAGPLYRAGDLDCLMAEAEERFDFPR